MLKEMENFHKSGYMFMLGLKIDYTGNDREQMAAWLFDKGIWWDIEQELSVRVETNEDWLWRQKK